MKQFIKALAVFLLTVGIAGNIPVIEAAASEPEMTEECIMPEKAPRVVDEADLLEETTEKALLEKLDEISKRQECDVVVVTVDSLGGKTPMEYADDFFDYNGYGFFETRDGLLLLVSMEYRDWWISTSGFAIEAFTDAGIEYMSGKFLPALSDGKYDQAFYSYAGWCDDYLTQAKTKKPYDVNNMPDQQMLEVDIYTIIIFYIFGVLIAAFQAKKIKARLKPVAKRKEAVYYAGAVDLYIEQDDFVNSHTVTKKIEREHT